MPEATNSGAAEGIRPTYPGQLACAPVAEPQGLPVTPLETLLRLS